MAFSFIPQRGFLLFWTGKVSGVLRVKGFTFSELLPGFHPQATQLVSSAITKKWLKQWAFDVKKYKNDRELRNFVSYRPQTISNFSAQLDFRSVINKVYSLFQVLSPTVNNPFNYLDKLLLKALFTELYLRPEISARGDLGELIDDSFSQVGATFDIPTQNILLSESPNDQTHIIFAEATKLEIEPLPVIARAALLLRVSTGCVSVLLNDAEITKDELTFVWDNYGFNHGFWDTAKPVSDFYTLWDDIESEYNLINSSWGNLANNPFSICDGLDENLSKLTQFNRAALWGL